MRVTKCSFLFYPPVRRKMSIYWSATSNSAHRSMKTLADLLVDFIEEKYNTKKVDRYLTEMRLDLGTKTRSIYHFRRRTRKFVQNTKI
jgi:hypothetical protein